MYNKNEWITIATDTEESPLPFKMVDYFKLKEKNQSEGVIFDANYIDRFVCVKDTAGGLIGLVVVDNFYAIVQPNIIVDCSDECYAMFVPMMFSSLSPITATYYGMKKIEELSNLPADDHFFTSPDVNTMCDYVIPDDSLDLKINSNTLTWSYIDVSIAKAFHNFLSTFRGESQFDWNIFILRVLDGDPHELTVK